MTRTLLSFDTDQIKNYVFATGKLKEIRGASALLDELNRQKMSDLVKGEKIFASGGGGLFRVDSEQAEFAKTGVEKIYQNETITASITGASVELPVDFSDGGDVQPYLKLLSYRLRAAKDSKVSQQALLTHSYLRFCDSCGTQYAEHEYITDDNTDQGLLCESCLNKRQKDRVLKDNIDQLARQVTNREKITFSDSLWHRLIPELIQLSSNYPIAGYNRPGDFDELADLSSPKGYMGLIYADGDAMGKELEGLRTLKEIANFAKAVDDSVYQAVARAITSHLRPKPNSKKIWPFDVLLLGGDDLVMVTRAEDALEVGLTVMEQFTQLTEAKYGKPLALSVGIVIAHANYPFGQLLRLGESALKFAKKEGAKRRKAGEMGPGGLLNFLVVSSSNHLEFEEYYNEQLLDKVEPQHQEKTLHRTLRPYSAASFKILLEEIRRPEIARAPRTKLEQLRALIFQSKRRAMIDGLILLFHWRSKKQREAIKQVLEKFTPKPVEHGSMFPWIQTGPKGPSAQYFTPLLDLVEIFDFVTKEAPHGSGD